MLCGFNSNYNILSCLRSHHHKIRVKLLLTTYIQYIEYCKYVWWLLPDVSYCSLHSSSHTCYPDLAGWPVATYSQHTERASVREYLSVPLCHHLSLSLLHLFVNLNTTIMFCLPSRQRSQYPFQMHNGMVGELPTFDNISRFLVTVLYRFPTWRWIWQNQSYSALQFTDLQWITTSVQITVWLHIKCKAGSPQQQAAQLSRPLTSATYMSLIGHIPRAAFCWNKEECQLTRL